MKLRLLALLLSTFSFAGTALAEDALIVHVIRSPGINWHSPRSLAKSTVNLRNTAYSIGHMMVEVRCGEKSVKSGMTQKYASESTRVVRKEEQALGVLFHPFKGKIQDETAVNRGLTRMLDTGRLAVIKFLVSPESCQRMLEFHQVFNEQEMFKNYGTLSRPLQGEGGGCSAYSVAYAQTGGFFEPWMVEQWGRYHRVPKNWVGGPLTRYRIGILKLMRKAPLRWAKETEKGFPMFLYDPDKVYKWVKAHVAAPTETVKPIAVTTELLGIPVANAEKVPAVEIDRRGFVPPPAINFSREAADPARAIREPALLDTWWEEEIRILKAASGSA